MKIRRAADYQRNKAKIRARAKAYKREKALERQAERELYYEEHKKEIEAEKKRKAEIAKAKAAERHRKYREKNKERLNARNREYYQKNKKYQVEQKRKWRAENPEESRRRAKEYSRKNPGVRKKANDKYRATVKGRISTRIGNAIRDSLKYGKGGVGWKSLVGYDEKDLEKHLKKTMPVGFTWDDFMCGDLHIDHKIPIAVFNYETTRDMDFLKCWALDNLQLLPAHENFVKNDRIDSPFQPSLLLR